jgi:hypothetical protein
LTIFDVYLPPRCKQVSYRKAAAADRKAGKPWMLAVIVETPGSL